MFVIRVVHTSRFQYFATSSQMSAVPFFESTTRVVLGFDDSAMLVSMCVIINQETAQVVEE